MRQSKEIVQKSSPAKSSNVGSYLQSSYPSLSFLRSMSPRRRGAGIQKPNQASPQSCAGSYVYMVGTIMFGFPPARLCKNPTFVIPAKETVQQTPTHPLLSILSRVRVKKDSYEKQAGEISLFIAKISISGINHRIVDAKRKMSLDFFHYGFNIACFYSQ